MRPKRVIKLDGYFTIEVNTMSVNLVETKQVVKFNEGTLENETKEVREVRYFIKLAQALNHYTETVMCYGSSVDDLATRLAHLETVIANIK